MAATLVWSGDGWRRRRAPPPVQETGPWRARRESIHDFIIRQLSPRSHRLADGSKELPDGAPRYAHGRLQQAAGHVDSLLNHLGLPESGVLQTDCIFAALDRIAGGGVPWSGTGCTMQ